MKNMQKGFTLIELMIVVAIIAILAAIAIPQYEKYVAKAQFSESQTVAAGLETDVAEYWTQNGSCPTLGTTPGFKAAGSYAGKYVQQATLAAGTGTGATCTITVDFKGTGSVSSALASHSVSFAGAASGGNFTWVCSTTTIDPSYTPDACH